MFEQSDVPRASFFPFSGVSVILEQLRSHLEGLVFRFFMGLSLDLLGEVNDRLVMNIFGLLDFLYVAP